MLCVDTVRKQAYDQIIRVDQVGCVPHAPLFSYKLAQFPKHKAGERGAQQIYAGQLAILKNTSEGPIIQV